MISSKTIDKRVEGFGQSYWRTPRIFNQPYIRTKPWHKEEDVSNISTALELMNDLSWESCDGYWRQKAG